MDTARTPRADASIESIAVAPVAPKLPNTISSVSYNMMKGVFSFVARLNPFVVSDAKVALIVEAVEKGTGSALALTTTSETQGKSSDNATAVEDCEPVAQVEAGEVETGTASALVQQKSKSFDYHHTKELNHADLDVTSTSAALASTSSTPSSSAGSRSSTGSPKRSRDDDSDVEDSQSRRPIVKRSRSPKDVVVDGDQQVRFSPRTFTPQSSPSKRRRDIEEDEEKPVPRSKKTASPTSESKRLRLDGSHRGRSRSMSPSPGAVEETLPLPSLKPVSTTKVVLRRAVSPTVTPELLISREEPEPELTLESVLAGPFDDDSFVYGPGRSVPPDVEQPARASSPEPESLIVARTITSTPTPAPASAPARASAPAPAPALATATATATAPRKYAPLPPRYCAWPTVTYAAVVPRETAPPSKSSESALISGLVAEEFVELDPSFLERVQRDPEYMSLFKQAVHEMYGPGGGPEA